MIRQELMNPKSIAIIGASTDIHKPGGKLLKNILESGFEGDLFPVNPKSEEIQGLKCYNNIHNLPDIDLAIIALAAKFCPETVQFLAENKNTKAFIIISAGFSEEGDFGLNLEKELHEIVTKNQCTLIGPNCIGVITPYYAGVFTSPVPKFDPEGCDLISGSGATAVFIMESGIPKGLTFSTIFSVGNSVSVGIEEVLEYLDANYIHGESAPVKLLYIESIKDPDKLLKHASSLIRKGARIAGIKAGSSLAGSRAASSHTGAMASSDLAVEALFRKAGIVRCTGREELTTVAMVLMLPELNGKKIGIITHAGGPAVMLTDALETGGLKIPNAPVDSSQKLLHQLFSGASVSNPFDLLATGTAEQLGLVIDYCENDFDEIDAIMVIFGSSGLYQVYDAYEVLHNKIKECKKPIFPILPSVVTARQEVDFFISKGHRSFPDEVQLAKAIISIVNTPKPAEEKIFLEGVDVPSLRKIIDNCKKGYQSPEVVSEILKCAGIQVIKEYVARSKGRLLAAANEFGYPLALKAVGPVHKSDIGGVVLNITNEKHLVAEFLRLKKIKGSTGVLIQPMIKGMELFIGAFYEPRFGHLMMCGMGGIFIETLKDISSGLAPLTINEADSMVKSLKSFKIMEGTRGQTGIPHKKFIEIIVRLSSLLRFAVEIKELDLNPLIATPNDIFIVDSRIKIS